MSCVDLLPTILAFSTTSTRKATLEKPKTTRKKCYQPTTISSCFSSKKNKDLRNEEFGVLQKFVKNRKTDWYMPNAKQDNKLHRSFIREEERSAKRCDTEPQKQFRNMLKPEALHITATKNRNQGSSLKLRI